MKKLLIAVVLMGIGAGGYHVGLRTNPGLFRAQGYAAGYYDGYWEGVLSCPCWEREGNICSLCGIKLEGTGQFKRIK